MAEAVKLVIWDLDETFWSGTLTEGGIKPIQAHIDMVKALTERGIVNSICSKNEHEQTREQLVALGVWDYFIFPKIEFAPKGAMIREIIEAAQLRTPSVLFIDDNKMNLNEALHYNPDLQVCEPAAIPGLLADPRLAGKPDPEHKRLARYKVLEKKAVEQAAAGDDNLEFLRQSEIRISFHHDVLAEFPRIHDLVNRTNQLNFTKQRWPEDIDAARDVFQAELDKQFQSHTGYVKVADRYGDYGIVGFYMILKNKARHFLFSCRTLNMGIEQFVWQRLGRPELKPVGEVVASLGANPDWITVVDDVDDKASEAAAVSGPKLSICVRGACDMRQITHYLRTKFDIVEEFNYPYKGWEIQPVARAAAVYEEAMSPAGRALIETVPGLPPGRFESAIHTGACDVYVLSFATEVMSTLYRSTSTGMILPFRTELIGGGGFRPVGYQKIAAKAGRVGITKAEWQLMQTEFRFHAKIDKELLAADLKKIFSKLQGKIVIVLSLNEKVGSGAPLLRKWGQVNAVIRPLAEAFGVHILDINDFVKDLSDLVKPTNNGAHFNRQVYQKLAGRITEIIAGHETAEDIGHQAAAQ